MKHQRQTARLALLDAFAGLALTRRYQDVGVGLIAGEAGVSRSTFYYHFKAKDDLLLANLQPMMAAFARLPTAAGPTREAELWVAHIWQHRALSRRMFEGSSGRRIADALTREIGAALGEDSAPLLAEQIAGSMLSVLRAWVAGRASSSQSAVAERLWAGARALAGVAK